MVTILGPLVRQGTLNTIFSVTYYFELHNTISIHCISRILPTNHEIGSLDIIEHQQLCLVKKSHQ